MNNNDILFFINVFLVEIFITIFLYIIIGKIINKFCRRKSHIYFKNNVVKNDNYLANLKNKTNKNIFKDISSDILKTFNTDNIDSLKDFFYDMFYKFEIAYNSLDYNIMKTLSTKQLFNNYYTGITLDLKSGQKKVISDIERKEVIIYGLDSTIARQTACVMIEISYITYTIDKNGDIISGNRNKRITEKFDVTFRKVFEKEDIKKCPNCGATIVGDKCEYCRTTLQNVEFKISNIKKII